MTDRIYYIDSYCRSFRATVTRRFEHDGRLAVTLDRTAFYPASGGQPCDAGRLDAVQVVDTIDAEEVIHIVSSPLAADSTVTGDIDWTRRFDHMQQHTGQHLLSAAFDRLFENPTVSFHMGADASTIDLARDASPADIERAVDAANDVIWEDRPVSIRFVSPTEAARLPLRKDPAREGRLRLIEIDGFDVSACGGTHVRCTGAVGSIAALAWERHRGGTRLTFVCGGRALRAVRGYRDAVAGSVRVLSVLPHDLPSAVERIQAESKGLQKHVQELQGRLARYEGRRLAAEAADAGGVRVIVQSIAGWDAAGLKAIAAAAIGAGKVCVALLSTESPLAVVVARSPGVPLDAQQLLRRLIERFGGRGGGKPDVAQGGGLNAPVQDVLSAARELINATLST
ncbi:MAG: alanyl-tRNA editing protein [Vicinamibacterales bacterium]